MPRYADQETQVARTHITLFPNKTLLSAMEQIRVSLKYEGPDVDSGEMSLEDLVPILQGFSSAYKKLADKYSPSLTHDLKITGFQTGSVEIILLDAIQKFTENSEEIIKGIEYSYEIVKKFNEFIQLKRHVKGKPHTKRAKQGSKIDIENADGEIYTFSLEVYEDFKNHFLDNDVDKMVSPLEEGHIHAATIRVYAKQKDDLHERIELQERDLFICSTIETTSTKEAWIEVQINSFTQSTNNGFLYLGERSRVPYRYKGENPKKLCRVFGAHYRQSVRAKCVAHMDETLKITRVDIYDIEPIQPNLFPGSEEEDAG